MPSCAGRSTFTIPALVPLLFAIVLIAAGSTVVYAWRFPASIFRALVPDIVLIRANAGAGVALAGCALCLLNIAPAVGARVCGALTLVARILAIAVMAIGTFSLIQILFGVDFQLDQSFLATLMPTHEKQTGSMLPLAPLCMILTGASLVLIDYRNNRGNYPAEYGAIAIVGFMGIPLIGYLYSGIGVAEFTSLSGIAPFMPGIFLIMALGILWSRPGHPLMSLWTSDAPGGHLVRRLLPASLLLIVVLNVVIEWGQRQGLYTPDKISPLVVFFSNAVLFILFCRAAAMLNREYGVRRKGEEALSESNALLQAVSDNTSDAIFVRDRNGRTIFANPAMLRVLGKAGSLVIGRTNAEIYSNPEDAELVDANEKRVMLNGQAEVIEETVNFPHGVRTFYSTKAPWLDNLGRIKGLVGISTDITDRKRVEDALRAHETQLEQLVAARTAEVSELLGHLESTREEEKRAIARELHDDLGSAFTALSMHLAMLFQEMPADPELAERAIQVKTLLSAVTDATRRIQIGLRPDKLDIFGIKVAIFEQALEFEKYTSVTCKASLPDEELRYSPQQDIALFRIVQETLNNIAKHAKATHVDVILDDDEDNITLTVRDNGIGITSARSGTGRMTHGLRGMRERAAYLGGQVNIVSAYEKGTVITVTLPKLQDQKTETVYTGVTSEAAGAV